MNFPVINNSYRFECTKCGNCCSGDQRVNLNPYDLYKMARFKGYDHTRYLFENGLVQLVKTQNNAWIPQIKFKSISRKKHMFCPFLINELDEQNNLLGLCSLHPENKPLICAMSPLGRIIDFKKGSEEFVFVKPAPDCPGVEREKENRLSRIIAMKKMELEYEKRFLKILDNLTSENQRDKVYVKQLYYFSVSIPFIRIIEDLERSVIKAYKF